MAGGDIGILYIVATPIGNLGDISFRALEVLGAVDFIAAEDTRVSIKLLNHYDIKKPLLSYHEHNHALRVDGIIGRLLGGESGALISDAGTPAISDPGEELVAACAQNGIKTVVIPGACAAVCALAVSGLATGRFCFEGFLSTSKKARAEHLDAVKNETRTLIFYEAPHKLKSTLSDMHAAFGDRRITLARELTKLHEEIIRTTLAEACQTYETLAPRGEFVLVIEGASKGEGEAFCFEDAVAIAKEKLAEGASVAESAKYASKLTGFKKSDIYRQLV